MVADLSNVHPSVLKSISNSLITGTKQAFKRLSTIPVSRSKWIYSPGSTVQRRTRCRGVSRRVLTSLGKFEKQVCRLRMDNTLLPWVWVKLLSTKQPAKCSWKDGSDELEEHKDNAWEIFVDVEEKLDSLSFSMFVLHVTSTSLSWTLQEELEGTGSETSYKFDFLFDSMFVTLLYLWEKCKRKFCLTWFITLLRCLVDNVWNDFREVDNCKLGFIVT